MDKLSCGYPANKLVNSNSGAKPDECVTIEGLTKKDKTL
jgi:hypothetical protein